MGPDGQGGCVSSYCAPKYVLQHARVLTYVKGGSSCTTGCNALTRSHDASIHHPQVWICHLRSSDPRSTGLDLQITGCEHSAHRMCRWSTHTYMHSYVRLHTRTCTRTYACTHVHAHVRCQVQHVQLPDALMQSTAHMISFLCHEEHMWRWALCSATVARLMYSCRCIAQGLR